MKKRGSQLVMGVIGTGLSERIRMTIVAMLGVTSAAGLALVLFLFQASLPIPTLGPLVFPPASKEGLQRGVALGGSGVAAGSGSSQSSTGGVASGSASALAVVVPPNVIETTAAPDQGAAGLGDSAAGVEQGQDAAAGGSQPASPSPASPVRQPGASPESETPAGSEVAPVVTPVTPPAPETPAIPTEGLPVEGELPPELEEPPVEEGEEPEEVPVGEGEEPEELEEPLLRPSGSGTVASGE